jgi:hypothetical protein
MPKVKNLDSKSLTPPIRKRVAMHPPEQPIEGFLSGDFDVTAHFSFHTNSPLKVLKQWIARLIA